LGVIAENKNQTDMKYSIKILEEEKAMMKKCLSNWDKEHYPEAHKERMGRLKDLDEAIEILKNQ
tara:strand:- start:1012 stop:1203 length:192 start_codon:yes stop_codon:yes gene_type:complete